MRSTKVNMKFRIKLVRNSAFLVAAIMAASGCGGSSGDGGTSSPRAVLLPMKSGWIAARATDSSAGAGTIVGEATTTDRKNLAIAWNNFKVQNISCTDPKLVFTGAFGISDNGLFVAGNGHATKSTLPNVLLIGNTESCSPVAPPPGKALNYIRPFDISDQGDSWGYLEYGDSTFSQPSYFFRTHEGTWTLTPDLGALSSVALETPPLAMEMKISALSEDRSTAVGYASFSDGSISVWHPVTWRNGKPTVSADTLDGAGGFSVSSDGDAFVYSLDSGITMVGATSAVGKPLADVIRSAGLPVPSLSYFDGRINNSGDNIIGIVDRVPYVILRYR